MIAEPIELKNFNLDAISIVGQELLIQELIEYQKMKDIAEI
jgi:hypothetical protein